MIKYCHKDDKLFNKCNVSSRGEYPWNLFSPFSTEFTIEHPIDKSIKCDSVERIWQGSKCCFERGMPDWGILADGKRWQKGVKPKYGIWIGEGISTLDLGLGRRLVYVPAYIDFVNRVLLKYPIVYETLKIKTQSSEIYYLHDFDYNESFDYEEPLSHAIILAKYLNLYFY